MRHPFGRWFRPSASAAGPSHAKAGETGFASPNFVFLGGQAAWSGRDYAALARGGYARNAIVHRCVRLVVEAAAALPFSQLRDGRAVEIRALSDLLAQPNPRQPATTFLENVYAHLLVSGNAYLQAVSLDGTPRELHALRPDRMRVVAGRDGWPATYEYGIGRDLVRFDQTGEGLVPILHLAQFHPLDDHYGLAPIEAAATALDIHNAAAAWNKALLDNAARPSGALVLAGAGTLSDPAFARLKEELAANYQGAGNAGRPLLLEGGLDWKPFSLSPKDMDFAQTKAAAAREIALAFGVPPLLLGLPGDNTHANYAEANRAFYRQSVIPLARRTAEALAAWLGPAFGAPDLRLEPDLDAIEALGPERESLWRRVEAASFLDADEKREAVGYGRRAP